MMRKLLLFAGVALMASPSRANVCGTDFQTFNPTTSGLDFITVHSSETLKPCYLNMGFFVNRSKNIITFNRDYVDANGKTYRAGDKPNDSVWGGDLSLGLGLSDNLDFGVSIPSVLKQNLNDVHANVNYESEGITEIRGNVKYRMSGDDQGGIAGVLSMNQNLIKNNPFAGKGSKPTVNLEFVMDKSWNAQLASAVNLGYRWRNQGDAVPNMPFEPLGDQWIYSVASSYFVSSWDVKFVFEVFGSQFVSTSNQASSKNLDTLEWQLGFKKDLSQSVAFHMGGGTQLASAVGSPEARVYMGVNWAFGPFCDDDRPVPAATEPAASAPAPAPKKISLNANILFDTDSDRLRNNDIPEIDDFFDSIDRSTIRSIVVKGHTDSIGSEEYNQNLSERRANTVKQYLLRKYPDLSPASTQAVGFGETQPIADNGNYQGRQRNRRVELEIEN